MNRVISEKKSINTFAEYLLAKQTYLGPEEMAKEFISFFSQYCLPTSNYEIGNLPKEIGIDGINYSVFPKNIRGFHSITQEGKITITLDEASHAGRIHTLYHEIYEIVCEIMKKLELKTEYKANLFAASIIMPEEHFFEYVIRRGLMLNEIKIYYSDIATDSILLRINHFFRKKGIFHIAFLLKNNNARKHALTKDNIRETDFKLHLSTLDHLDSINNRISVKEIISQSCERIFQNLSEESSLVKFSIPGCIVMAESILFGWGAPIKEIAIQILDIDVYNSLGKLLKEK